MEDNINHPKHYTSKSGVECIQITEQFNFNRGNAIKYIWRAGEKDKTKIRTKIKRGIIPSFNFIFYAITGTPIYYNSRF